MTGRMKLLAGIGAVSGVLAMSGAASADVAKPAGDARVPAVKGTAAGVAVSAPSSATVSITGQYQTTNYNCVPASSAVSLATLGSKVTQASLAKQMKTTPSGGTSGANAMPVLNKYGAVHGYKYGWADVSTGTKLLNAVAYDAGTLKRAATLGVWMEQLPWNDGMSKSKKIGHDVVVYGYDKSDKTIKVWDPWKSTGGRHKISASTLSGVSQDHGLAYITKR